MVKLNNFSPSAQSAGFQTNSDQSSPAQNQASFNEPNQSPPASKGLISLPPALMQIIPWIPFALEAMTGQKIPPMGGTIAEIQASLTQMQFSLSQVLNQQSQLLARLNSLENNASTQLNSLSQQVASTNKSFHLLATEKRSFVVDQTKRSLEFSPPSAELTTEYQ